MEESRVKSKTITRNDSFGSNGGGGGVSSSRSNGGGNGAGSSSKAETPRKVETPKESPKKAAKPKADEDFLDQFEGIGDDDEDMFGGY